MRVEVRQYVRRPDIASGMTESRLEMLWQVALGLSHSEIAVKLGSSERAVTRSLQLGYQSIGTHNQIHAVLTLVARGTFDLEELSAGFDLSRFDLLRLHEHRILQRMTRDNGSDSSNHAIARDLGYKAKSVGQRMHEIHTAIGEFSRPRIAVLYVAYQERTK